MSPMQALADKGNKNMFFKKRKGCPLSTPDAPKIDYKDPEMLKAFISDGGRILPSRITNVSASKQRQLKRAIKTARILGLLYFIYSI
ncbi:MAG: 30S ribosomal protein S18 [Rickettsiaceae bacterium]